jgi:hypothetical protein
MTWPFDPLEKMHYGLILADPPWRWEAFSEKGEGKSASQHYSVMDLDALMLLPVHMLGADDSMLVMWATQAQLPDALRLMDAWGYTYKTAGAWAKQSKTGQAGLSARATSSVLRLSSTSSGRWARRSLPSATCAISSPRLCVLIPRSLTRCTRTSSACSRMCRAASFSVGALGKAGITGAWRSANSRRPQPKDSACPQCER